MLADKSHALEVRDEWDAVPVPWVGPENHNGSSDHQSSWLSMSSPESCVGGCRSVVSHWEVIVFAKIENDFVSRVIPRVISDYTLIGLVIDLQVIRGVDKATVVRCDVVDVPKDSCTIDVARTARYAKAQGCCV